MMEPSMLSALWLSFYSKDLYGRVQRWRGKAIVYLAAVLVLCWTHVLIRMHFQIKKAVQEARARFMPQLPVIRFEHGQVSTPENRPYLLRFGAPSNVVAIIDTSGHYTSLDGQEALLLITRDKCFLRQRGEVRAYDLSKSKAKPIILDQDFLEKIVHFVKVWTLPPFYVLIYALSFLKRLIEAFFIALVGLGLATLLETDLDLGELLSLAIVSMTPAMIFGTLLALSGKHVPLSWLLSMFLTLGYFIFAVNAASERRE